MDYTIKWTFCRWEYVLSYGWTQTFIGFQHKSRMIQYLHIIFQHWRSYSRYIPFLRKIGHIFGYYRVHCYVMYRSIHSEAVLCSICDEYTKRKKGKIYCFIFQQFNESIAIDCSVFSILSQRTRKIFGQRIATPVIDAFRMTRIRFNKQEKKENWSIGMISLFMIKAILIILVS